MKLEYCYNTRSGEIFGYIEAGNYGSTFPDHLLMVDADAMIRHIATIGETKEIVKNYGYCRICRTVKPIGKCDTCNSKIKRHPEPKYLGIYR